MSVVEIASDGIVRITPFTGETHSTVFVSGPLYVLDSSAAPWASLLTAPPDSGEVTARGLWHSAGTPLFLDFRKKSSRDLDIRTISLKFAL